MIPVIKGNKYTHKVFNAFLMLSLTILSPFLFSCNEKKEERKVEPAFYYWKSTFHLSDFEKMKMDSLKIKVLYIKFFDVDWDEATRQTIPKALLRFADSIPQALQIIPAVFITNECFKNMEADQVPVVAAKTKQLIEQLITTNKMRQAIEIQIDCDWTESTREKYFSFLTYFKKINPLVRLSATIRLHQIKFIAKSGVPPVDRGLLMCYNMGNLKNPAIKNSILEAAELKKYTGNIGSYTLPLDVAFPLFGWKVLFRENEYRGLIQHLPDSVFSGGFFKQTFNNYEVLKDSVLQGYELKKGDILRKEESLYKEIIAVANEINSKLKNTPRRVSLYHLDSITLSKFSTHELESIYNSMR